NIYKDRIPSEFFPIAHDAGGNLILMGPNSDDNKIYFWDHEIEADEGDMPDMSNVYLISQSFSVFINSLYEVEI
ncbi:SMI1/KNR4 family protein, partial [Escherichia coli]|nr:SMI1/KNR4 family protein [Escherichia coli]